MHLASSKEMEVLLLRSLMYTESVYELWREETQTVFLFVQLVHQIPCQRHTAGQCLSIRPESTPRSSLLPLLFLSLLSVLLKRNAVSILCNYHSSSVLRHVVHLRWDLGPSEVKGRFGFSDAEISSALLPSALDKPFCQEKKKILFWQIVTEAEWSWTSQLGLHLYSIAKKSFSRANYDWRDWIHRLNLRQKGTPQSFSLWVFLTNC